jgi:hypothetical protein
MLTPDARLLFLARFIGLFAYGALSVTEDHFESDGRRFEAAEMDRNRVARFR